MNPINTLPVLFIIAGNGFQPIEYARSKKILEENEIKVVTASNKPGTATASDGTTKVHIDLTTDAVKIRDYRAIFLIGGPGALENLDNETTYKILKQAKEANKPFGAICISTRILANAGVIKDKKVTGWDEDNALTDILKRAGAIYIEHNCVIDVDIVTAKDPSCAQEFGEKIFEVLKRQK